MQKIQIKQEVQDWTQFTQGQFMQWLQAKPAGTPVGHVCSANDCPLHRFFDEVFSADVGCGPRCLHCYAIPRNGVLFCSSQAIACPDWASRFIKLLDRPTRSDSQYALAGECLEVLSQV